MPPSKLIVITQLVTVAALAGGILFTSGCATTQVQAQWTDPQFAGKSLHGANVLVVCDASDVATKRICQDQLSSQLQAAGAMPVTSAELDNVATTKRTNDVTLAAARNAGAKAVFSTAIGRDATVVNPGPSIGVGLGSFGGGLGGGLGVSLPVGGGRVNTAYGANAILTDVDSGKIMWSSKVTTPASSDINGQIAKLTKAAVDAAQKAGLL
ncbi:MAG: hypothetical protein ABI612_18235 [Betaproteobacteria bacterium]